MTCANCSGTIEAGLSSLKGVVSCKVALLAEKAEIVYDPSILNPQSLCSEIEDLGFETEVRQTTATLGSIFVCRSLRRQVQVEARLLCC